MIAQRLLYVGRMYQCWFAGYVWVSVNVRPCLHVTFFSPSPLFTPFLFTIESIVTVWIMDRIGDGPILSIILRTIKITTDIG